MSKPRRIWSGRVELKEAHAWLNCLWILCSTFLTILCIWYFEGRPNKLFDCWLVPMLDTKGNQKFLDIIFHRVCSIAFIKSSKAARMVFQRYGAEPHFLWSISLVSRPKTSNSIRKCIFCLSSIGTKWERISCCFGTRQGNLWCLVSVTTAMNGGWRA